MRYKVSGTVAAILLAVLAGPTIAGCSMSSDVANESSSASGSTVASTRMAKDFPLASGAISQSQDLGADGWSATVAVADAQAQQNALDALTAAGFTIHGKNEGDPLLRTYSLNNDIDAVTLTLTQADGKFLVSYSVAPISH